MELDGTQAPGIPDIGLTKPHTQMNWLSKKNTLQLNNIDSWCGYK